jgi:hypothetical protein
MWRFALSANPTRILYSTNKPKVAPPGRGCPLKQNHLDKVKNEILIAPLYFFNA